MNLKRKFLLPLLGVIVLVLALAFASACNEHVHTYSDEWESDSTYHWHEPTCDDTDKVADKAEHTYRDGVCTVCGVAQPETENPQPDPDKKDYDMSGVMFEDLKVVYDGEAHSIFIKGELPDGVNVSYEGNGMTNVGQYTVTAHFTGDTENYQEISDKTAKLTIEQAAVEGITFDGETVPYDGEAHSIFIKGELPDGVSVSYDGNGMTNVGEYTVVAKFTTDENHKPISDMEATLIIEKATFDMAKVKFEDETVPYDGEAHSITAANLPTGVQATYEGNGKVNAGTYQITAHFIVDTTNYNTIADRHATLTIEKIDYDLSGITFEGLTTTYDGKTHPLAIKGQLPTGVDVSYENNAQTTAGEHKVIAHFTGDTQNHNLIPDKEATLTIEKATYDMEGITFEGLTTTYDGKTHPLAIKGQLPTGVKVSYENNAQTAAGQYEVIAHFTGDKTNYHEIPDKKATLIIEQATVEGITFAGKTVTYNGEAQSLKITGNLPAEVSVRYENNDQVNVGEYEVKAIFDTGKNYKPLAEMTAKLIIEQAAVERITFAGKTVTYNGETQSLKITGNLPEGVSVRYENNDQVNVGEYEVKAIFDTGKNYKPLAEMTAKLVIEKATYDMKSITFEGLTVTYDGNTHPLAIQGQLPKDVQVSYENNEQTTAGRHKVIAHFTGDTQNHNLIPDKEATLTIEKATYDMDGITFEGLTVPYDKQTHPLAIKGDLPAGVDVSYENNSQTTGGQHEVIAHFTGDAQNYNLIPDMKATLTIEKLELTIAFEGETEIYYDGQEHKEIVAKPQNLLEGDSVEIILTYSGNMIEAGDYTVTATIETNPNYQLTKNNTLTVSIIERLYKVIFRQEGQTDKIIFVKEGAGLTRKQFPALAEIEGYYFEWEDIDLTVVTGDVIVNAVKTIITYIIDYHTDDDVENENPSTYDVETSVELKDPLRNGYRFLGWFTESTYDNQVTEIAVGSTGNRNLYAQWELITYNIVYHVPDGSGYAGGNPLTYDVTCLNVSLSAPYCYSGYNFCGWFLDEGYTESISVITIEVFAEHGEELHLYARMIFSTQGLQFEKDNSDGYRVTGYTGSASSVIIPALWNSLPVIGIASAAFQERTITDITIPESIISIDNDAFKDCTDLTTVYWNATNCETAGTYNYSIFSDCTAFTTLYIGENVESISDYAFSDCASLVTVYWNAVSCTTAGSYRYPIFRGCTALTTVYFGENVENIPSAFSYCTSLESITIPESVTSIGEDAFYNCTSLKSITIPESVTFIGDAAFGGCTSLESITIPDSVTSIGDAAFGGCRGLTSVDFGDNSSLTAIGDSAFYNCTSLESITIPESVTSIGNHAFTSCTDLTTVYWNATNCVKAGSGSNLINYSIFEDCTAFTTVYIGENVESIPPYTFYGCASLETVYWNAVSCTTAGSFAHPIFEGCTALTTVHIGENVESIPSAFSDCTSLESVNFGDNSSLTAIGDYAFYYCTSLESITIPNSVTSIGDYAFYGCNGFTSITIPENVTSIGDHAFYGCNGFTSITIPENVTSIGDYAFYGCTSLGTVYWNAVSCTTASSYPIFRGCTALTTVYIGENVENIPSAFSDCTSLESITIPESVTSIGAGAFSDCTSLESITIPENVTSIGERAFYRCNGCTSITIPANVTSIGDEAFSGCTSLESVHITDIVAWCAIDFGDGSANPLRNGATLYLNDNPVADLREFSDITEIKQYAFYGYKDFVTLTIPNSVTSIGDYAFSDCESLVSVIIPNSVTSIGDHAFDNCTSLESIDFGNNSSLTTIGNCAFSGCTSLESITIPNSVTSIGNFAFGGCRGLTSVDFGDNSSLTAIGGFAFEDCTNLESVIIPKSVTSIDIGAFEGCTSLGTVYWDAISCTTAGSYDYPIFRDCTAFTTVYIGENVESIPHTAFYKCTNIATIYWNAINCTEAENLCFKDFIAFTTLYIGENVMSIPDAAFSDCISLGTVYWNATNCTKAGGRYIGRDGTIFRGCTAFTTVYIGENVEIIPNYVFYNCTSLTSVEFGNNSSLTAIGEDTFGGCTSLESIIIPESVTFIGISAFYYCRSLTTVYWNATNCTKAGDSSNPIFRSCLAPMTVYIGENVESIPDSAFYQCTSLESIIIPESVTSIGEDAFSSCICLKRVYYGGDETSWNRISISRYNHSLESATRYYYSETAPNTAEWKQSSYWWHRDPDTGEVQIWKKES